MRRVPACAVLLLALAAPGSAAPAPDSLARETTATAAERTLAAQSLYQSAESALAQGEYAEARSTLKVLIDRYPSSEQALRGQRMLLAIPGADLPAPPAADAPYVAPLPSTTPEDSLARLRAAISAGREDGHILEQIITMW